jgi:hypothetical protein
MRTRLLAPWLLLAILLPGAVGSEDRLGSVERVFGNLAFRPHFPREQDIRKEYGDGFQTNDNGGEYLNYYLANGKRWLRFRIDTENRVDRPITAVLISKFALASEPRQPRHHVNEVNIKGVKLGDSAKRVKAILGSPLRQYEADLGANKNFIVFEYFPKSLDAGSCIRFYIKRGTVTAFSFSSEQ